MSDPKHFLLTAALLSLLIPSCTDPQEGVGEIALAGSLDDAPSSPTTNTRGRPRSLRALLQLVHEASQDEELSGVLVRIGDLSGGPARFGEARDALLRLREEGGVTVHCHLESASNYSYWLAASSCERLSMSPTGSLELTGLATESYYLRELLEAIGAEGDFLQVGTHKGAAEFLLRDEMSPETRETLDDVLDRLTEEITQDITAGRGLEREQLQDLIDQAPLDAPAALAANLVDAIEYHDEALEALQEAIPGEAPLLDRYDPRSDSEGRGLLEVLAQDQPQTASGPRVAVLYLSGAIVSNSAGSGLLGDQISSSQIRRILEEIREDEEIRALVVRIESPGGSALASDEIWHALIRVREQRPVVATMGDVAASGGYYIAAAASELFAQPGTLTGSIGVVGGKVVFTDLLDRVGVHPILLKRGRNAGLSSLTRSFTESQRSALQHQMDTIYERFIQSIVLGRVMDEERLRPLATGRVWTGRRALELGLVDHLGGLHEAIAMARELGGLPEDAPIEVFPKPLPLVQQLEQAMTPPSLVAWPPAGQTADAAALLDRALTLALLLDEEQALTLWPLFLTLR